MVVEQAPGDYLSSIPQSFVWKGLPILRNFSAPLLKQQQQKQKPVFLLLSCFALLATVLDLWMDICVNLNQS